jgi:hypothetical protein
MTYAQGVPTSNKQQNALMTVDGDQKLKETLVQLDAVKTLLRTL